LSSRLNVLVSLVLPRTTTEMLNVVTTSLEMYVGDPMTTSSTYLGEGEMGGRGYESYDIKIP
jgi:hypothetical protein